MIMSLLRNMNFLAWIANPTVIYILLLLGIYGVFTAFVCRRLRWLSSIVAVVLLLLAFVGFRLMPVNFEALTLILIGIGGMVAEIAVARWYILGVGGVAAFVAGSMMLFLEHHPPHFVNGYAILVMCIISGLFFVNMTRHAIRS